MPDFQASIELPQAIASVFEYIRRPTNLVRLLAGTTEDLEFRVPERLEQGSQLEFSLRRLGMKIVMVLEVVDLIEQQRIFLKQQKGPFLRWFHEYLLAGTDGNHTLLTERVFFEPPTGFLGMFITNAGVLDQLQKRIISGHRLLKEEVSKLDT